jgi:hypothetical protein
MQLFAAKSFGYQKTFFNIKIESAASETNPSDSFHAAQLLLSLKFQDIS